MLQGLMSKQPQCLFLDDQILCYLDLPPVQNQEKITPEMNLRLKLDTKFSTPPPDTIYKCSPKPLKH